MDFSKKFLAKIILDGKGYSWTQKLDYEQIHFICRVYYEIGNLSLNCKKFPEKNKERKTHRNPTWWIDAKPEHQQIWKDLDLSEEILVDENSSSHLGKENLVEGNVSSPSHLSKEIPVEGNVSSPSHLSVAIPTDGKNNELYQQTGQPIPT